MKKKTKVRIDQALIERGLAPSLAKAQALVLSGQVVVDEQKVDKVGFLIGQECNIRLLKQKKYASRAGEKLESAILGLNLREAFKDKVVLDIGSSTGGFTDCVLKFGAKEVISVDVGFNQMDFALRQNPRIRLLESTDIRDFDPKGFAPIDWILCDVSFDNLIGLADAILRVARDGSRFLLMVKPQFELEAAEIPEGGVLHSQQKRREAIDRVKVHYAKAGLIFAGECESAVSGRRGNIETFLYFIHLSSPPGDLSRNIRVE